MRLISVIVLCCSFCVQLPASAASHAEVLGSCLVDNTSGKDRKELARWIFVAMAAHPDIRDLSAASDDNITQANKNMATLVMRLLTENCTAEVRAAINDGGSTSMFDAFKALGEVAMRELMGNRNVAKSVGDYVQYLDKKKLESVMSTK